MSGVRPGTSGLSAVRGACRGLCLAGFALFGLLAGSSWVRADDDQAPPDPMSNRSFLQNGQQASPGNNGAGKKNPMMPPSAAEEDRRIGDLIAKRQAEQEGEFIAEIAIEGNSTIPTPAILQKLKVAPGRKASVKLIQEDVRALWKTGWFYTVETRYRPAKQGPGQVLVFVVFERPIVRSVAYVGNHEVKTKKLEEATGLKVGSPFDASANVEAAKKIESFYREQGYSEATVDLERGGRRDDRDVVFRIHEGVKQKIMWRDFEGNQAFSSELLSLQLVSTPAYGGFVGGKFDPAKLPEDCAKVRKYYENLGYFDAKVAPEVLYSSDHKWIKLLFHVQEGPHYKIRTINVMGNTRFSTADLQKDIKTHEGEFYNAYHINKDIAKIKKKYGELGYTYCKVDIVPRYLPEPGKVDLLLRIDEDRTYTIRKITVHIEGDHSRTRKTVALDYIGIAPGELADPAKIQKSKGKLTGAKVFDVAQDGTGEGVRIKMTPVTGDYEKLAANMRGQSGDDDDASWLNPSGPIGDNIVGGNLPLVPRTPPPQQPVMRGAGPPEDQEDHFFDHDPYLCQPPDDDWTGDTVIRGQTGADPFGSPANPMYSPSPQGDPYATNIQMLPGGQIDLDYYLKEARTGRLMFGVGVNSSSGLVGSIVFEEQNFDLFRPATSWADLLDGTAWRGAGQRFRVEAMPGTEVSRYTISWSDPYFMHTNWTLGTSVYYFQRYYLNWTEDRVGGRINIGRQLSPEWAFTSALRLEGVRVSNATFPTPSILEAVLGDNFLSTVRGSLIYDTRDMPFMPGEGHKVELSYEQGFGDFNYPRAELDGRQYFTLYQRPDGGGRQILTVGGMLGWTGDNTPIFERFFAGGFQSFRGFAFRGVSPVAESNPNVYIGGQFMAVGTLEYQVPLLANSMVSLVTFSDFGTVEDGVTLGGFRCSVGAGFRVALPMLGPVPLAFDFAVPVVRQQTDITQVFSFYVGLNR